MGSSLQHVTNTISLLSFSCYIQDGVVKIKLSLCISKSLSAITFSVLKVFDFIVHIYYVFFIDMVLVKATTKLCYGKEKLLFSTGIVSLFMCERRL